MNQPALEEKEWEDTTIIVIQSLGKVIKSFLNFNLNKIDDLNYYKENFLSNMIEKFVKIVRFTSPELASTVIKCTQEIYHVNVKIHILIKPILYFQNFDLIWKVFDELGHLITTDLYLNNFCTMSTGSKMILNTTEILKEIFTKSSNIQIKSDIIRGKNLENLYNLVNLVNYLII